MPGQPIKCELGSWRSCHSSKLCDFSGYGVCKAEGEMGMREGQGQQGETELF